MSTTYVCMYCLELYIHNLVQGGVFSFYPTLVLGIPGISDHNGVVFNFNTEGIISHNPSHYVFLHQKADLDGVANHMKNFLDIFTCRPMQ